MTFSDPVSNMLASIRNANLRGYHALKFPYSKLKWEICKKMQENNFLSECWFDQINYQIKVRVKYTGRKSNIHQLKKISKPSQHIHWNVDEIKKNSRNFGIYFISTSFSKMPILTNREALDKNIGGKVILFIS